MTTFTCARCKEYFRDARVSAISGIYGSHHVICEPCFFDEEAEQDERGTNDLPETLASYGPENDHSY